MTQFIKSYMGYKPPPKQKKVGIICKQMYCMKNLTEMELVNGTGYCTHHERQNKNINDDFYKKTRRTMEINATNCDMKDFYIICTKSPSENEFYYLTCIAVPETIQEKIALENKITRIKNFGTDYIITKVSLPYKLKDAPF